MILNASSIHHIHFGPTVEAREVAPCRRNNGPAVEAYALALVTGEQVPAVVVLQPSDTLLASVLRGQTPVKGRDGGHFCIEVERVLHVRLQAGAAVFSFAPGGESVPLLRGGDTDPPSLDSLEAAVPDVEAPEPAAEETPAQVGSESEAD